MSTDSTPESALAPSVVARPSGQLPVRRPTHVWSTDITYIRLHAGLVYLVAMLDGFSRYVLSCAVSMTMDVECCLAALEQALEVATPAILNSDQGPQLTSLDLTRRLEVAGIRISMDGRGQALDNIFVERLLADGLG